jgi:hypothetical protein
MTQLREGAPQTNYDTSSDLRPKIAISHHRSKLIDDATQINVDTKVKLRKLQFLLLDQEG